MARVKLISYEEANPEQLAFYDDVKKWLNRNPGPRATQPRVPQPWRAWAHNPKLARIIFEGSSYILSDLPWAQDHLRLRQFAILAVVCRLRCTFAYVGHWPLAEKAGIARELYEVFRDWEGLERAKTDSRFTGEERLVIRYADQLARQANTDEETFAEVKRCWGDTGAVELTAIIAYRIFTSVLLSTLDIQDDKEALEAAK